MDKLIIPSPSNGIPFNWDDLDFSNGEGVYNGGIIKALEGQLKKYGNNFVVSGCEVIGSNVAEGWVMLGGELIKVDAHTKTDDYYTKVITYNSDGNKQDKIAGNVQVYQQNRATATAVSGDLIYNNRLDGSYTVVGGDASYTKTKLNESIFCSCTDTAIDINLGAGNFESEKCIVFMESDGSSGEIDVIGSSSLFVLDGINANTAVRTFIYINGEWRLKDKIPDADINNKGIQENSTSTESYNGILTNKTVTPDVNAQTLRYLSKTLANGEDYVVANKVGKIIIPSSVTGGTINMPANNNTFIGQQIHILSTGGSSVPVYLNNGTTVVISTINLVANKLYILTWTGSVWWTTAAIDAPGTLIA